MPVQPLAELIRFVRRQSPFYAELYAEVPDPVTDLTQLPVVPQTSFWQANTPRDNRLLTGPLDEAVVFKSGGTTGSPKFSYYTRDEWREFTTAFGAGLLDSGIRPGHRVADLFYAGELYASFTFVLDALHHCPASNVRLPIGGSAPLESTVHTLEQFDVQVVAGTPTTLCALADHLVTTGRQLPQVELLLFGGESLYLDQQPLLARAFPRARPRSVGYASVDAGLLGRAVPDSPDPRVHQAFTPFTAVEILDEETDEPITEPGAPGKVVVSDLRRRLMPVLRYPAGDRAEWTGTGTGHFRILGRSQEGVRVGPVSLYTQDVLDLVRRADVAGRVTGVQMVLRHWDGRDSLLLRLASDGDPAGRVALEDAIRKELLTERPLFGEAVDAGHIHPLSTEWVRHGDLAVNARSGKLIRVVDERMGS